MAVSNDTKAFDFPLAFVFAFAAGFGFGFDREYFDADACCAMLILNPVNLDARKLFFVFLFFYFVLNSISILMNKFARLR